MTHLQTNGHNNTDKEIKMAMERNVGKKQVKITGTAKSTGGNTRNQPMKELAPVKKTQAKDNLIQDITNRFRVTAREARDIVTAVGTLAQSSTSSKNPQSKGPAVKNLVKQVKETASAAATGKKGTTSDRVPVSGSMTKQTTGRYSRGSSRS
jgi:hypothetical protein